MTKSKTHQSTRDGRKLNVAFTVNEHLFDGTEPMSSTLFLSSKGKLESTFITLRVTARRNFNGSKIHHLDITFNSKFISTFRSFPLQNPQDLPPDFKVPNDDKAVNAKQKRVLSFEATDCTIRQGGIPKLKEAGLQSQMNDLVRNIGEVLQKGETLKVICVADDYRKDGATFETLQEATQLDTWVKSCWMCGRRGICKVGCPDPYCSKCKISGTHWMYQCPELYCEKCETVGHEMALCPHIECPNCGQMGHMREKCTVEKCDICKALGHTKKKCPQRGWTREYCARCRIVHSTRGCNPKMMKYEEDSRGRSEERQ